MGQVTHAYITYTDDTKKFFTVPITEIKCLKNSETHIQPKTDSDFEKRKRYYVKWSDCGAECDIDHEHFGYYSAFILYLGESLEHIQKKISDGGRLIIPRGVNSSESDEPVRPLRRPKHNTIIQDVLRKKNIEVLDKHKAKTFLSARKELINNSDDEAEQHESNDIDYENNEDDNSKEIEERIRAEEILRIRKCLFDGKDGKDRKELINNSDNQAEHHESDNIDYDNNEKENSKEIEERIRAKEILRIRKCRFDGKDGKVRKELINNSDNQAEHHESDNIDYDNNGKDNPKEIEERIRAKEILRMRKSLFDGKYVQKQEPVDQSVNNETYHDEGAGYSGTGTGHTTVNKPIIMRNEAVNLRILLKSKTNDDKPREHSPEKKNTGHNTKDVIVYASTSADRSSTNLTTAVVQKKRIASIPETVDPEVHGDPSDNNNSEEDSDDNQEQPVRERLPPCGKKRKPGRIVGGLKKKSHREILEALQYYENQEADPDGRKRYEISANNMIYLGEGLETSAPVWFLIQQDKPQIFFSGMLDLLWTQRTLVNRCQNKKKVTTRLQDRSPMKELTPKKKKLSLSLYSDYLDRKKIKGAEKMQCLSKVPYLITTKINYLRSKYYTNAD